jgi:hypothetical protein
MGTTARIVSRLLALLLLTSFTGVAEVAYAQSGSEVGPIRLLTGLRLESGYNTNLYRTTDPNGREGVVQLNVNPTLRAQTIRPRIVALDAGIGLEWSQYLGDADARRQSGETIDGDFELRFNPNGLFSVAPRDEIRRTTRASFGAAGEPFQSTENTFELELALHPGGADRPSRLGLSGSLTGIHRLWRYDRFATLNKNAFGGRLELKYNFLPKTAVFINALVMSVVNASSTIEQDRALATDTSFSRANPDSTPIRVSAGLTGLLLPRLGLLLSAGYGTAQYRGDGAFRITSPLVQVRLDGYLTERTSVYADYQLNFADGVVEDAYQFHRGELGANLNAGLLRAGLSANVQGSRYQTGSALFNECANNQRRDTSIGGDANIGVRPSRFFGTGLRYGMAYQDSNCTQTTLEGDGAGLAAPGDAGYTTHSVFLYIDVSN